MRKDTADESTFTNLRYYHSRLLSLDEDLFEYSVKKGINDSYARKCIAQKDNQPIVLKKKELLKIDKKTGFKNGVLVIVAYHVEGK